MCPCASASVVYEVLQSSREDDGLHGSMDISAAVRAALRSGCQVPGAADASGHAGDHDRKALLRNVVREQKAKAKASNKRVTFNFSAIRNMVAQRSLDVS